MKGLLLDTNVVSELRKGKRADLNVKGWFERVADADLFLSVLVVGEIRSGVERIRRTDAAQARILERWLQALQGSYEDRILPITAAVADRWGRMSVPGPIPVVDGLMAATALEADLTLVTRNTQDVAHTGVKLFNPFEAS